VWNLSENNKKVDSPTTIILEPNIFAVTPIQKIKSFGSLQWFWTSPESRSLVLNESNISEALNLDDMNHKLMKQLGSKETPNKN